MNKLAIKTDGINVTLVDVKLKADCETCIAAWNICEAGPDGACEQFLKNLNKKYIKRNVG